MTSNPYESPTGGGWDPATPGRSRDELRLIAKYQKGVIACLGAYLLIGILRLLLPGEMQIPIAFLALAVILAAIVFVFLLAARVFSTGVGVLLGILLLVPCLGVISLLVVNGKATSVLKQHHIPVGFLGARMADI